jgi:quercetin dioxygenase-like cupin family protein
MLVMAALPAWQDKETRPMLNRKIFLAAGALAAALLSNAAAAGECPADKQMANAREPVTLEAVGVTDTVLAALDLANEAPMLQDRKMRVRKLVIEPDGVVPWHSHADRPALIYVVEGEIHEYSSDCAGPITHKAGEVSIEDHGISHWWKNLSSAPVTLLSFDILHEEADQNAM